MSKTFYAEDALFAINELVSYCSNLEEKIEKLEEYGTKEKELRKKIDELEEENEKLQRQNEELEGKLVDPLVLEEPIKDLLTLIRKALGHETYTCSVEEHNIHRAMEDLEDFLQRLQC